MARLEDLSAVKFGRLIAVRYEDGGWLCRCDCGGTAHCLAANLKKGNSTSCGCKRRETNVKHGRSDTPLYQVWLAMRQRCQLSSFQGFHNYGGRGIKVCERWEDFGNFLADMGERPEGTQVDRWPDKDGDYTPENCRWATPKQNMRNTRTNRLIEWRGETLPLAAWAERLGINERTFTNRLNRGWPLDRAMTEPVNS